MGEIGRLNLDINNSRVLITGSSKGIGQGIASAFLEEGAFVILNARDIQTLTSTGNAFAGKFGSEKIEVCEGDVCDPFVRDKICEHAADKGLDHLVCNVGSGKSVPTLKEDSEEWLRVMDNNFFQAACLIKELRPILALGSQSGRNVSITIVGSICGMEDLGCPATYSSAKAALWAYLKNLVRPLAKDGIRINQVTPGNILFRGSAWESKLRENEDGINEMLQKEVALGRFGSIEEVSAAVVFLSSKQASFITGANLVVDGGQTRSM